MSSSPSGLAPFAFEPLCAPVGAPPAAPPPDLMEEAARIREEARAAGNAEGYQAGLAAAAAELEPAAVALGEALVGMRARADEMAAALECEAAELAVRIAEKVVAGAIETQPERVVDVVRMALRALIERERVTVLVSPDDLEIVRSAVADVMTTLGGIAHLEVQAERRVSRGGAIVRTAEGEVDATIEGKLERARDAVLAGTAG
jgi:flagellar assembly protein FliH